VRQPPQFVIAAYDIDGNIAGYLTIRDTLSSLLSKAAVFSDQYAADTHVATHIECWQGWQHYMWVSELTHSTTSRPIDTQPSRVPPLALLGRAGRAAVNGRKRQPTAPSRQAEPSMPKPTTDKVRTIKGKPVMRTTARKAK
jgi:hypothetical protein